MPFPTGGYAGRALQDMARARGVSMHASAEAFNKLHAGKAIREARSAKSVSRIVAGATLGAAALGTMRNRNGRAVDRQMGRPTGMYGY